MARDRGEYRTSLGYYGQSLLSGGLSADAVLGIVKLLPHWLLGRLNRNDPRKPRRTTAIDAVSHPDAESPPIIGAESMR